MNPKIIISPEKKVLGLSSSMQQNEHYKILQLWQQFMPRKKEISNGVSEVLIALQLFPENTSMHNINAYEIWACVEVKDFNSIPNEMETFTIPKGDYAVFIHKGMDASSTYQRIMTEWLPTSGYEIDNRPHFQVMGEKYKNGSPDSEEDFYVPIKPRIK